MKKTGYSLIALGLGLTVSSIVLAGNYNPPEPSLPCSLLCSAPMKSGFYVGVTGLYLTPSQSVLPADSWQYVNATTGQTTSTSKTFDPSEYWSIGAKLGYNFGESANDVEFNYFYFNSTTDEYHGPAGASSFYGTNFNINIPDPASIDFFIDGKLKYTLNQYDLLFGHTYSQSPDGFSFKPSIGLRYATLDASASSTTPAAARSHFQSVGPEIALDARQGLRYGFGLVGHFDAAAMASSVDASSFLYAPAFLLDEKFKSPSQDRVTSAMTGKLGLDYRYALSNQSVIALEGGYQATRYQDAIDSIKADAVTADGSQQIRTIDTENFSLMGPYLSVTFYV